MGGAEQLMEGIVTAAGLLVWVVAINVLIEFAEMWRNGSGKESKRVVLATKWVLGSLVVAFMISAYLAGPKCSSRDEMGGCEHYGEYGDETTSASRQATTFAKFATLLIASGLYGLYHDKRRLSVAENRLIK